MASVVIPAWNEETTIGALIDQLKGVKQVKEIIVIDDGCADKTGEIARKRGAKLIKHEKNLGKGKSLLDGIKKARENLVVLMDADLQHDPADIPKLLNAVKTADMAIGVRDYSLIPFPRKLSNFLCSFALWLKTRRKFRDVLCGYRCIRKSKFVNLSKKFEGYEIELGMLKNAVDDGFRIKEVPVITRYGGKSKMRTRDFILLSFYTLKMVF